MILSQLHLPSTYTVLHSIYIYIKAIPAPQPSLTHAHGTHTWHTPTLARLKPPNPSTLSNPPNHPLASNSILSCPTRPKHPEMKPRTKQTKPHPPTQLKKGKKRISHISHGLIHSFHFISSHLYLIIPSTLPLQTPSLPFLVEKNNNGLSAHSHSYKGTSHPAI